MKRLAIGALALALLSAAAIGTAQAGGQDDGKSAISDYCRARGDFRMTHGACVAYFVAHNVVPHDAAVCQDEGMWSFLGVASHGECVTKLAEMRD
jgi:hypothetical protein